MFNLKHNTNYHTWTLQRTKRRNQWQYWIIAAVFRCSNWCTVCNRYDRNFSSFVARWALVIDKHFLCPEILVPVGVLLYYSALRCQDTHCYILHEQQQTISMRSNVREWTHVQLVTTPCSHLHSFCATGVSSGLATRVTLTRVSWGRLEESITKGLNLLLMLLLHCSTWLLLGCVLNDTHRSNHCALKGYAHVFCWGCSVTANNW
jgi:hypothetical protein